MQTHDEAAPVVMTIAEAARQLRVSRNTIYRLMDAGELDFIVVASDRRIRRTALLDYIERQTESAS